MKLSYEGLEDHLTSPGSGRSMAETDQPSEGAFHASM